MSPAGVPMPLPVLIPLTAAALTLIAGVARGCKAVDHGGRARRRAGGAAVLRIWTDRDGTQALQVGGWGRPAGAGPLPGITLVADRLSALMLVVSAIVLLAWCSTPSARASGTATTVSRCRSSCPPIWCLSAGCAAFRPVTCSTCSSGSGGAAVGELRAADHRAARSGARRHLLRDGVDGVVADLPDRHRADLRRHRHPQHGRAGCASTTSPAAPATRCSRSCWWPSGSRRRCSVVGVATGLTPPRPPR